MSSKMFVDEQSDSEVSDTQPFDVLVGKEKEEKIDPEAEFFRQIEEKHGGGVSKAKGGSPGGSPVKKAGKPKKETMNQKMKRLMEGTGMKEDEFLEYVRNLIDVYGKLVQLNDDLDATVAAGEKPNTRGNKARMAADKKASECNANWNAKPPSAVLTTGRFDVYTVTHQMGETREVEEGQLLDQVKKFFKN